MPPRNSFTAMIIKVVNPNAKIPARPNSKRYHRWKILLTLDGQTISDYYAACRQAEIPCTKNNPERAVAKGLIQLVAPWPQSQSKLKPPTQIIDPPTDLKQQVCLQFKPVLSYRVEKGRPVDVKELDEFFLGLDSVVYARFCDDQIIYIGKSDGPLRKRLRDHIKRIPSYKRPKDIDFRTFVEGKTVTILAFQPSRINLLGLSVPIHAGVESALIEKIHPRFVARR